MTFGFASATVPRESTTPLERRLSRAVAVALLVLLGSTVLQSTVFLGVNRTILGSLGYDRVHLVAHAAIILIAVACGPSRRRLVAFEVVFYWLAAYGAAVFASTVINVEPLTETRVLQALLIPITVLSLGVALPAILTIDDYDLLFRGVIAIFIFSAVVSLGLVITHRSSLLGHPLVVQPDHRGGSLGAAGLFTHRNTIGSFLQFVPVLILAVAARSGSGIEPGRHGVMWWIWMAALALVLVHLVLTFSRSSQIVVVLSLLPLLVRIGRARSTVAYAGAAVLILVLIVGVVRIPEFAGYVSLGLSLRGREFVWKDVLVRTAERPILGFGLLNAKFREHTPHNAFLAQLAYFGGVGLTLFVGLLVTFGVVVWRRQRARRDLSSWMLFAVVVAALLQGFVEYVLTFPVFFANSMFWILAGLLARSR